MGERGPAPKPTRLRVLEGNPSHRPLPMNEANPRRIMPSCPSWLSLEAKREWHRIAPKLFALGLLTEVDGRALALYCDAMATWKEARAILHKKGLTFTTPSGYKQQRPEVAIARNSALLVRAFGAEFGLTPSARTRIATSAPSVEDDSAGVLS